MRLHSLNIARLRYRHHIRQLARIVFWLVIAALTAIGAYSAMTEYQGATAAIKKAEADRQEVLDVLAGKLVMVLPVSGGNFAEVATVKWELVKEVGK